MNRGLATIAAAVVTIAAAQVIAAPPGIEQPAAGLNSPDVDVPLSGAARLPQPWVRWAMIGLGALALGLVLWRGWHRLDRFPARPPRLPLAPAAMLFFSMFLLGWLGALATVALGLADSPPLDLRSQATMWLAAYAVKSLALLAFLRLRSRLHSGDERVAPMLNTVGIALLALLITYPIMSAIGEIGAMVTAKVTGQSPEPVAHDTLRSLAEHAADAWSVVIILLALVAAPIFEEVTYRGMAQEGLRQAGLGRWSAIVASSVFFTIVHVQVAAPHALPALFILSLALGWAYERTGRLLAPIVMHVLFNAGNLALLKWMIAPGS